MFLSKKFYGEVEVHPLVHHQVGEYDGCRPGYACMAVHEHLASDSRLLRLRHCRCACQFRAARRHDDGTAGGIVDILTGGVVYIATKVTDIETVLIAFLHFRGLLCSNRLVDESQSRGQLLTEYVLRRLIVDLILKVLERARKMIDSVGQIYDVCDADALQNMLIRCDHLVSDVEARYDFIDHL